MAMWVNLPDINQLFGQFKGKFRLLEKLRFVWMLKRRRDEQVHQTSYSGSYLNTRGKGVGNSFMIVEGAV